MLKSPALLVSLEGFWPSANQYRLPVNLPPVLHRIVADHRALGYSIVPVGSSRFFGISTDRERLTLQTDVEMAVSMRGGVPIRTVLIMDNPSDPRELWDMARSFDVDLKNSMLVSQQGHHVGVCRTAGVGRWATESELTRSLAFA
jgi:hypothetical protein